MELHYLGTMDIVDSSSPDPRLGTLLCRQLTNVMINDGIIISPDISKHLDYLTDKEYIEFIKHIINKQKIGEKNYE